MLYKCSNCYENSQPNVPISYGGCLPSTYDDNTQHLREFVLQMIDLGYSYGYSLSFDNELVFEAGRGNFTDEQLHYFGGGNDGIRNCSDEIQTTTPSIIVDESSTTSATSYNLEMDIVGLAWEVESFQQGQSYSTFYNAYEVKNNMYDNNILQQFIQSFGELSDNIFNEIEASTARALLRKIDVNRKLQALQPVEVSDIACPDSIAYSPPWWSSVRCLNFHVIIDIEGMDSANVATYEEEVTLAVSRGDLYDIAKADYPETLITGLGNPGKGYSYLSSSTENDGTTTQATQPVIIVDTSTQATQSATVAVDTTTSIITTTISSQPPPPTKCTEETSTVCGKNAKLESTLLMQRGATTYDNILFGSAVTFVGDSLNIIAVGVGVDNSPVFVYRRSDEDVLGWEYLTAITLPEAYATLPLLFGKSLDSNYDGYIVVGAPASVQIGCLDISGLPCYDEDSSGYAFVYKPNSDFNQWELVSTLQSPLAHPSFGSAVTMDELVAVGSPHERYGTVYIFEETGVLNQENSMVLSFEILPDNLLGKAQFGISVSLSGETLVVGAPYDSNAGSIYVYTRSDVGAWLPTKLRPPDIAPGDAFGSSVIVSGCTIVASSPQDDTDTSGSGTVRTFVWDGSSSWDHVQIVRPTTTTLEGGVFGECFAFEGDVMIVTDYGAGVLYTFGRIGGVVSP